MWMEWEQWVYDYVLFCPPSIREEGGPRYNYILQKAPIWYSDKLAYSKTYKAESFCCSQIIIQKILIIKLILFCMNCCKSLGERTTLMSQCTFQHIVQPIQCEKQLRVIMLCIIFDQQVIFTKRFQTVWAVVTWYTAFEKL